ncbi:MAG: hypothetical protein A2Y91_00275 [Chloroflexi bacterium RBG_13_54_8]|nr:MAG: hypothetical protein A2Y91_00275 [Chloroflexi bacterium RBG_13_54_8]
MKKKGITYTSVKLDSDIVARIRTLGHEGQSLNGILIELIDEIKTLRKSDRRPYLKRLSDKRWKRRRMEVLKRDGYKCRKCGAFGEGVELHVHHKLYKAELQPWEYPDALLITLCAVCHEEHEKALPLWMFGRTGDAEKLQELESYLLRDDVPCLPLLPGMRRWLEEHKELSQ